MKNRVITISRESLAAAAHHRQKRVAEKLGIPCYPTREIIEKMAEGDRASRRTM